MTIDVNPLIYGASVAGFLFGAALYIHDRAALARRAAEKAEPAEGLERWKLVAQFSEGGREVLYDNYISVPDAEGDVKITFAREPACVAIVIYRSEPSGFAPLWTYLRTGEVRDGEYWPVPLLKAGEIVVIGRGNVRRVEKRFA